MESFHKAVEKLDFNKILHRIQFYASSDLGKEAVELLEPCSDIQKISTDLSLTSEIKRILESEQSFPIDGIKDIRAALQQATIANNIISSIDFLAIASTLQASRVIKSYVLKRKEYRETVFEK